MLHPRKATLVTALLVLPVPGFILYQVLHSSPMQFYDYWSMISRMFDSQGRFLPVGLLHWQNEHFVLVPRILFVINVFLFHGSNITLALFNLVVTGVLAVLLYWALPDRCRQDPRLRALSLMAVAALVFTPQAMDNFQYSMSGASFIEANLIVAAACYALWKGRFFLAVVLGLLASATCGTALMVWPTLVFVALLTKNRPWRVGLLAGCMAMIFTAYFLAYRTKSGFAAPMTDPIELIRSWALTAGQILTFRSATTRIVGYVGAILFLGFFVEALRRKKTSDQAFWLGIGSYTAAAMALIAFARTSLWEEAGLSSRYTTLVALFWLSLIVLGLERLGWRMATAVLLPCFLAVFLGTSYPTVAHIMAEQDRQTLLAMAVLLNEEKPKRLLYFNRSALPAMRALGHYPFQWGEALDCGRMDSLIRPEETADDPSRVRGRFEGAMRETDTRARVWGWAESRVGQVRCILIVDRSGRVAGLAKPLGRPRGVLPAARLEANAVGWQGYLKVRDEAGPYRALVGLKKDGRFYWLSRLVSYPPGG